MFPLSHFISDDCVKSVFVVSPGLQFVHACMQSMYTQFHIFVGAGKNLICIIGPWTWTCITQNYMSYVRGFLFIHVRGPMIYEVLQRPVTIYFEGKWYRSEIEYHVIIICIHIKFVLKAKGQYMAAWGPKLRRDGKSWTFKLRIVDVDQNRCYCAGCWFFLLMVYQNIVPL